MNNFKRGLKAGIPIGLGYLSVSFTFGIMAVSTGFSWWQAVVISMTTLTSAGQFSGIKTMLIPGQYAEMLISQFTINIRYSFMSISLSQKLAPQFKSLSRWLLGFFITDEIFAVASTEKEVTRSYFGGLAVAPWFGWTLGTLSGALLGEVLPEQVMSALSLAIYGMFVAIITPEMKKSRPIVVVVIIAVALSCAFTYIPGLKEVSGGLAISICAIAAAGIGAALFPVKE
ncbi:MAG: AzlC family ABC transporter permease [Lachnospiraceae bacterium]|nr:AzlC family ABC transporter permease [Lachnospiraceae bacterium]